MRAEATLQGHPANVSTDYVPLAATAAALSARSISRTVAAIHPGVFAIGFGAYAGMLLGLWVLFVSEMQTFLSLAVCTAYFAMYFGVPAAFRRITPQVAADHGSFRRFLRDRVATFGGYMSGWSVLIQVTILPVTLGLGLIAMGVILHVIR